MPLLSAILMHRLPVRASLWLRATLVLCIALLNIPRGAAAHPRLFFDAADIPALQARAAAALNPSQTLSANPYNEILIDCRSSYGPSQTIPNSSRKRNAQALVSHGALLLLEPNGRAIDTRYQSNTRFFQYYDAVLNWNQDGESWSDFFGGTPLDTSLFLTALCTGYDWHYDRFTADQRTDIITKLAARADYLVAHKDDMLEIPADLENPGSWYLHTFKVLRNRSVIPAAALATIAYTLEGEVDETRRQTWLTTAENFLTKWEERVSWDGVSHEGYSYHEYLNQTLYPMMQIKSRRTGVNQFTRIPYLANHPLYSIYAWVPGGDRSFCQPVPFSDCETGPPADMRTNAALSARMLKGNIYQLDRLAQWMEDYPTFPASGALPNNSYSRVDPMQFFWLDDTITPASPTQLGLSPERYFPNRGLYVWRSGWDHMATYFGMICGPTIGGHQLPENGNFVIYKGGSPFVGHHMKTQARMPGDYNTLTINGTGQIGENYEEGTTKPAAPSDWASVSQLIEDPAYFNILCNLQPIYSADPQTYTREFVMAGGYFLVRDKVQTSANATFRLYTQGYSTIATTDDPTNSWSLNLDSNPNVNPFTGSGRNWKITPRSTGVYTGALTVNDLSKAAWTPSVQNAVIDGTRRGSQLVRTLSGKTASSLVAYGFANATDVMYSWNDGPSEGMVLTRNSALLALVGWSDSGSFNNGGFTLAGTMGGLDVVNGLVFGRDATHIEYYGTVMADATQPMTLFANTLGGNGGILKIISPNGGQLRLRCPASIGTVKLNGVAQTGNWSSGDGLVTLQTSATTSMQSYELTAGTPVNHNAAHGWTSYN